MSSHSPSKGETGGGLTYQDIQYKEMPSDTKFTDDVDLSHDP